jgi:regulatory protein
MATRNAKRLNAEGLWDYALRALGRRPHSEAELRQELGRRAADPHDVAATLARLREYGLADDRKFSEVFAISRLQNERFGRLRVLRELRQRRVPPAIAEQAVEHAFSGTEEAELANAFLEHKYRGKNLVNFLSEEKNLASAYRRLRTAGFSSGIALSVLKRHAKGIELEDMPEENED